MSKNEEFCVENEEFCVENEEFCVENEEFCVKNEEFCISNDGFCSADRRGAAYGLAGLVKGLGLSSLKQHQIIPKLSEMVDPKINKKNNLSRQGALWGFECLCLTMGRLFEPYVIHILPLLLECFNSGESIREAAFAAADAIMSQLSGSDLHSNRWILYSNRWILHSNRWILHSNRWILHSNRWILHSNRRILHSNR